MCTEWCKPVHWAIVMHSFRKLRCCLHSVLISSWSQLVRVLCRLEAALQIISLQSDLQTLAQLEQKHKPPQGGPPYGARVQVITCAHRQFLHPPLPYSRGPRPWCRLRLRVRDNRNSISFRRFERFLLSRHFRKDKSLNPNCCVFVCGLPFFRPLQHCSDFLLILCWVWSSGVFCLWPQSEHTCRLWGFLLYLAFSTMTSHVFGIRASDATNWWNYILLRR